MKNLIINFHVVNDAIWFENVVRLLNSKYTFVDLNFFENLENLKNKGFCHITFDDGDRTFYDIALPILKKYNVPTTIFISSKIIINQENFWFQELEDYDHNIMVRLISEEFSIPHEQIAEFDFITILKTLSLASIKQIINKYQIETKTQKKAYMNMSLDEILELNKLDLVTIGAHTLNHPILQNESTETSRNEISDSITALEKLLGHEIKYFAYPNGARCLDFDKREIDILKENKIEIAVTTDVKLLSKTDNKLALPRLALAYGSQNFIRAKLILGSYWEKIKSLLGRTESIKRRKITSIFKKYKQ